MRGKMATGAQTRVPAPLRARAASRLVRSFRARPIYSSSSAFLRSMQKYSPKYVICAPTKTHPGKVSWGARRRKRAALAIEPRLGR